MTIHLQPQSAQTLTLFLNPGAGFTGISVTKKKKRRLEPSRRILIMRELGGRPLPRGITSTRRSGLWISREVGVELFHVEQSGIRMKCPVCEFVEHGGKPGDGWACPDCKANDDLIDQWRQIRKDFIDVRMALLSAICCVTMMFLIGNLLRRGILTVHDGGMNVGIWSFVMIMEVRQFTNLLNESRQLDLGGIREQMFVFKLRGPEKGEK
jgi:hypothetical protein